MSRISKQTGSCKKCKRNADCSGAEPVDSSFTIPILWGSGEVVPIGTIDIDLMSGFIGGYVNDLKSKCNFSEETLNQIQSTMTSVLGDRLNQAGIKPPPAGKCQYVEMNNIKIGVQITNCVTVSGPSTETSVTIDMDISVSTRDCPPDGFYPGEYEY